MPPPSESAAKFQQNTVTILQHLKEIIDANDKRYEERFKAQEQAVGTAMIAQEKAVSAALLAAKEAVGKAETATDARLLGMNEFRRTVDDLVKGYMTRLEVEQRLGAMASEMT